MRSKLRAHLRKFTYSGANSFTLLHAWRREMRGGSYRGMGKGGRGGGGGRGRRVRKIDQAAS